MGKLQRYFLTGLLTLLPIWLVWIVFKFVFAGLSGLSRPLTAPVRSSRVRPLRHTAGGRSAVPSVVRRAVGYRHRAEGPPR